MTSWEERNLERLTQKHRNRADAENMGWTGYTKRDIKRIQLVVSVYNWWGIFTRMGTGGR